MSATLSRRLGRVSLYPPIVGMSPYDKLTLGRLAEGKGVEFADLPERYQRLIVEAEANRQRHIEATAA